MKFLRIIYHLNDKDRNGLDFDSFSRCNTYLFTIVKNLMPPNYTEK